jgi:hypothetical protein
MTWQAGRGTAGQGSVRLDVAWHGRLGLGGESRPGAVWHGWSRHGWAGRATGSFVRAALFCWPLEWRHRRRVRADVEDWLTSRFWRRARTTTKIDSKLVEAANSNRRAATRAALRRRPLFDD